MMFHCIWVGHNVNEKHLLCLKSFQKTQSGATLWWWTLEPYVDTLRKFCEDHKIAATIKIFPKDIDAGVLEEVKQLQPYMVYPESNVALFCDYMRYIILYAFGGVYFDMDMVFLKDWAPLMDGPFMYRWEKMPYANNAIMCIPEERSSIVKQILMRSREYRSTYPLAIMQESFMKDIGVVIYDCSMFDNGWLTETFDAFFESRDKTKEEFFGDGSYAYHWHNRWTKPIETGSIAARMLEGEF